MVGTAREPRVRSGQEGAADGCEEPSRWPREDQLPVLDEAPPVVQAALPAMPELLRTGEEPRLGEDLQASVRILNDVDRAARLAPEAIPAAPAGRE